MTAITTSTSLEIKALSGSDNNGTLKGTYEPIIWTTLPTDKTIYGFAAETKGKATPGAFVKVKTGASIAPFRAYLEVAGTAGARMQYDVVFGEGNATGISTVKAEAEGVWYSLDGRQLQAKPTRKGVYIKNGKKTVVK